MAATAFQRTFNPTTIYLWPDLTERHPDAPYHTLWATNLPFDATEDQVSSFFSNIGVLITVTVIKEAYTFAYVCYRALDDGIHSVTTTKKTVFEPLVTHTGIKALCTLNDRFLRGKRIRVSVYLDDASNRRKLGGSSTIFIDGIPLSISITKLFEQVRCFGLIISLKFVRLDGRTTRRQAQIEFAHQKDAETAVRYLHLTRLWQSPISAGPWADLHVFGKSTTFNNAVDQPGVQIYISPVFRSTDQAALLAMFEIFGVSRHAIKSVEFRHCKYKRLGHTPHAFVEFHQAQDAQSAIDAMNLRQWYDQILTVSHRRRPNAEHQPALPHQSGSLGDVASTTSFEHRPDRGNHSGDAMGCRRPTAWL